jgi:hypothetical protein
MGIDVKNGKRSGCFGATGRRFESLPHGKRQVKNRPSKTRSRRCIRERTCGKVDHLQADVIWARHRHQRLAKTQEGEFLAEHNSRNGRRLEKVVGLCKDYGLTALSRRLFRVKRRPTISLRKIFSLSELWRLEFRAELFNAFNHAVLSQPDNFITDGPGLASTITSTVLPQREVQFGLKRSF